MHPGCTRDVPGMHLGCTLDAMRAQGRWWNLSIMCSERQNRRYAVAEINPSTAMVPVHEARGSDKSWYGILRKVEVAFRPQCSGSRRSSPTGPEGEVAHAQSIIEQTSMTTPLKTGASGDPGAKPA